jgi:hypothetical protein
MRQQPWPSQTARDRTTRRFRLYDVVALRAAQFRPNMPDNFKSCRHVFKHFRNIFIELAQTPAARRTAFLLSLVNFYFTWKMIRQGTSPRLAYRSRKNGGGRRSKRLFGLFLFLRLVAFQFFQLQLELFNLALKLFRFAAKLQPA